MTLSTDPSSISRDELFDKYQVLIDSISQWPKLKTYNFKFPSEIAAKSKIPEKLEVSTFHKLIDDQHWFARSCTIPQSYPHYLDIVTYITGSSELGTTHSDYERGYIHELKHVECSNMKIEHDGWSYFLKAVYEFSFPVSNRVFYEWIHVYEIRNDVYIISQSIPNQSTSAQVDGAVVGEYNSIEKLTIHDDGLEWTMATVSDPSGRIPEWLTNATMPKTIAKDVPSVLLWINKLKRESSKG